MARFDPSELFACLTNVGGRYEWFFPVPAFRDVRQRVKAEMVTKTGNECWQGAPLAFALAYDKEPHLTAPGP
jgi:hypothetical protein